MEILELGLAAIGAAPALAVSWWALWARRGRRRNARDACARCGRPLYGSDAVGAPHRVQGKLVCGPCGRALRTRTLAATAGIGLLALSGVGAALGLAVVAGQTAGLLVAGAIVVEYGLLFGGAAWWMKRRNRLAAMEAPDAALPRQESTEAGQEDTSGREAGGVNGPRV